MSSSTADGQRPPTLASMIGDQSTQAALPVPMTGAQASTSAPPTAKKRKGEGLERESVGIDLSADEDGQSVGRGGGSSREGKRTRVHFSCVECHRRKQKCDRKEPCSQCVARRVPHLCRPFLNGVEDPNTLDVQARLSSIEGLLGKLVNSLPSLAHARPTSNPASPDVSSLHPTGEDVFHPRSAPGNDIKQTLPFKPPPSGLFPASLSHDAPPGRSSFGWGLREGRMISLSVEENPDLREVLQTLKESGLSKGHLEWLIAGVPGRRMADGLVELYFRDIDWTRYKINKPSFMKRYEVFFDSLSRNPSAPKVDADTLKWLPLLFIVLAIATLSAPTDLVAADEQSAWSRRFYGSARSGLEYAKALQRDNLDVLCAGLLASRYMLLTRRPAEGSTPLTTAFQLGLYRDGSVLNITDKREVEIRRRAWAMLYHLDRTISLLVGRPASISDAHTDTRPPANLDDEELESDFDPAGHPLTRPTVYTYVIVRHKLAEIMGRIAYHTFAIQLPDYGVVLNLDRELLAWRESLPSFFSMNKPDTSLDKDHPYLFVQRHLLACEWFYTRITLNRPYLLRRKPQDGRYGYSKNAAIESATADLLNRRAFLMEKGNLIVNSGGYRVLNSYMVLGVTIKLDPDSPHADELRRLLNIVSGRAPDSEGRVSEPLVKEELAIVEFLTAKSYTTKKTGPRQGQDRNEDQTPVDLLLGLAKTRSGKRAAEEEQRQLRLQQYREAEEQRRARGNVNNSPWGYVAPQMPGLDVQQPFGDKAQRRVPRPLAAPSSRKSNSNTNIENNNVTANAPWQMFEGLEANLAPPNFSGRTSDLANLPSPRRDGINLDTMQFNNSNIDTSSFQNMDMDMTMSLPPVGADLSNTMFSLQQAQPQQNMNMMDQTQQQMQENLFGNALMDSFDFSDLGLGTGAVTSIDGGGFNPFAIAQAEADRTGSEGMSDDDQTQFLNYILTKIAGSNPEPQ